MPIGNQRAAVGVASGPRIVPAGIRTPADASAPFIVPPSSSPARSQRVNLAQQYAGGATLPQLIFDGPAQYEQWSVERIFAGATSLVAGPALIIVSELGPSGAQGLALIPGVLSTSPGPSAFFGDQSFPAGLVVMGGTKLVISFVNVAPGAMSAAVQFEVVS